MATDLGTISGAAYLRVQGSAGTWGDAWVSAAPLVYDPITQRPIPATAFEQTAGTSRTLYWRIDASAVPPAGLSWPEVIEITAFIDGTNTVIRTWVLNGGSSPGPSTGSVVFWATHDGTETGTPMRGMIRLRVRMESNVQSAGTDPFNIDSDGTNETLPASFPGASLRIRRGYLRSGGPLTLAEVSRISTGGTPLPLDTDLPPVAFMGFGETQYASVSMGAKPYASPATLAIVDLHSQAAVRRTMNMTWNAALERYVATDTLGPDKTYNPPSGGIAYVAMRIRFAATTIIGARAGLSVSHWTSAPPGSVLSRDAGASGFETDTVVLTNGLYTIFIGLHWVHLHQVETAVYATPPMSLDSDFRKVNEMGFVSARLINENGVGVNGIEWTTRLYDTQNYVSDLSNPTGIKTVTSATRGGEAGWADEFLGFNATNPKSWTVSVLIAEASRAGGIDAPDERTRQLDIRVINSAIFVGVSLSHASVDQDLDHWHPGDPLRVTVGVLDVSTGLAVLPDAAPSISILRDNAELVRWEYLDAAFAWQPVSLVAPVYTRALAPSGDGITYALLFTAEQTVEWGAIDLLAVTSSVLVDGLPYGGSNGREAVGRHHPHSRPSDELDATVKRFP